VVGSADKGISLINSSNTELIHMRQEAGDAGAIFLKDAGGVKVLFTSRPSNHSYFNVSGGNFGIRTASPTRVLQVNGAAHATSHLVGSLTTALGIAGSFPDANDSELGPGYLVMTRDDTAAAKQLQFWKNGSLHSALMTDTQGLNILGSDGVSDVTIGTDGNIGIGTNVITQKFEIYKSGNDTQLLVNTFGGTADTTQAGIWFRTDNSNAFNFNRSKGAVIFRRTGNYGVGNLYLCVQSNANSSSAAVGDAKLTIIQDGNVGIGTLAPAKKFHVYGNSKLDGQVDISGNVVPTISTLFDIGTSSLKWRNLVLSGTLTGAAATFSGSVGIGTTAPDSKLEINTPTTNAHLHVLKLSQNSWSSSQGKIKSIVWDDLVGVLGGIGMSYDGSKTSMHFHSFYNGGYKTESVELMTILGNGNVGIGTNVPAYQFCVGGAWNALYTDNTYDFSIGQFGSSANVLALHSAGDIWLNIDSNSNDTTKKLYIAEGGLKTAASAIATFQQDGNVGIGTTAPNGDLQVKYGGSGYAFSILSSNNSNPMLNFGQSSTDSGFLDVRAGNASKVLLGTNQPSYFMGGSVGIGTTGPTSALSVSHANSNAASIRVFRSNSITGTYLELGTVGGSGRINCQGGSIAFQISGTTKAQLTDNGNFGINYDTAVHPAYNLQIGSYSIAEDRTLAILGDNVRNETLRLADESNNWGFDIRNNGGSARLEFIRHSNSSAGTVAVVIQRDDGNVGIGTSSPAATLHVRDTSTSTSRWTAAFVADNAAVVSAQAHDHVLIQSNDVPSLKLYEYGQDQVGGICVGDNNTTISSTETLRFYVNGSATGNLHEGLGGTMALQLNTNGTSNFYGSVNLATNMILSLGTGVGNAGKIRLYGGHASTDSYMDWMPLTSERAFRFAGKASTSDYTTYFTQAGTGKHNLWVSGTFETAGACTLATGGGNSTFGGCVGIGMTPTYTLQVNGSFAATSKSFVIDHPVKPNYMLEYGSLEGPEFGVYYRGRVQSDTITLPDYWSSLVRDGTITVQLTPNGSFQHLYVVSTSLTEIKIGAADGETIDCYYVIYGERADLDPLVVEKIV